MAKRPNTKTALFESSFTIAATSINRLVIVIDASFQLMDTSSWHWNSISRLQPALHHQLNSYINSSASPESLKSRKSSFKIAKSSFWISNNSQRGVRHSRKKNDSFNCNKLTALVDGLTANSNLLSTFDWSFNSSQLNHYKWNERLLVTNEDH